MLKSCLPIACYDLSHIFVVFNKDKNKSIKEQSIMTAIQLRAGRLVEQYIDRNSIDINLLMQAKDLFIHELIDYKTVTSLYNKLNVSINIRNNRISKVLRAYELTDTLFEESNFTMIELNKFFN